MEAYQYAYNKTVVHTKDSRSGTQHPNAQFEMEMEGDVVLTDFSSQNSGVLFPEEAAGHFLVVAKENAMAAEFTKEAGSHVTIALKPGTYGLFKRQGRRISSQEVTVDSQNLVTYQNQKMKIQPLKGYSVKGHYMETAPQEFTTVEYPYYLGASFSLLRVDTKIDMKYFFQSGYYAQASYLYRNSYVPSFRNDYSDLMATILWGVNNPLYLEHWAVIGAGNRKSLHSRIDTYAQLNVQYGWIKYSPVEQEFVPYQYDCPEGTCYDRDTISVRGAYRWFNWQAMGMDVGVSLKISQNFGLFCETGAGVFLMDISDMDFYSRPLKLGFSLNL